MKVHSPRNNEPERRSVDPPSVASVDRASFRARFGRTRAYACPKCGGRFVRMHRRFGDRLFSVVSPVRRFRCTQAQCRYECTLPKGRTARHERFIAAAGLLGVTLAGALVMGIGLYLAADETARNEVFDDYSSLIRYQNDTRSHPNGAPPAQPPVMDLQYESASMVEAPSSAQTGDLALDFVPPLPGLQPDASRAIQAADAR